MKPFAELLDRLVLTPSRNGKLKLMGDYFRSTPDPDRGLALAALTSDLSIPSIKPAMLRALVTERMDEVLFGYSYDYVGDLAETVSLVWPEAEHPEAEDDPRLADVVADIIVGVAEQHLVHAFGHQRPQHCRLDRGDRQVAGERRQRQPTVGVRRRTEIVAHQLQLAVARWRQHEAVEKFGEVLHAGPLDFDAEESGACDSTILSDFRTAGGLE